MSTFTDKEFWPLFARDLSSARARVIIQSPFVAARRIKQQANDIRAITRRRIAFCIFVQTPRNWTAEIDQLDAEAAYNLEEFRLAIAMLQSWGIHVNLRKGIHGKFAVIDDRVLWEGSLNILSHFDAKEHMRRLESSSEIRAVIDKHRLADCGACEANLLTCGTEPAHRDRLLKLGSVLATRRDELKLSARALEKRVGIPHSNIAGIEKGRNFTVDTLFQISDGLDLQLLLIPKLLVPSVTKLVKEASSSQVTQTKAPDHQLKPSSNCDTLSARL